MKTTPALPSTRKISSHSTGKGRNAAALSIALLLSAMPVARALVIDKNVLSVGLGEWMETGGESDSIVFGTLLIDTNFLTIAPFGTLNLRNNAMIVRQSPFASIYGYMVTGYNGGAWNGYGINSSIAAADPDHLSGLGIINNAEALFASFAGRPTPLGTETFVKYTLYGDANLDELVDETDLALMGLGTGWYHGDFNYDGTVDAVDYALFDAGRASQTGNVPEPGSLSLLMAGIAGLAGRRRVRS